MCLDFIGIYRASLNRIKFKPYLSLDTLCHQCTHILELDLLRNVLGLDFIVLRCDDDEIVSLMLPTIAFNPVLQCRVLDAAQQLLQQILLDCLERGSHYMRDKFAYGIMEAGYMAEHGAIDFSALPEQSEVSALQYVCQIDNGLDILILHLLGQQQALGHNEICVGQVRQALQQNRVGDVKVEHVRIELI